MQGVLSGVRSAVASFVSKTNQLCAAPAPFLPALPRAPASPGHGSCVVVPNFPSGRVHLHLCFISVAPSAVGAPAATGHSMDNSDQTAAWIQVLTLLGEISAQLQTSVCSQAAHTIDPKGKGPELFTTRAPSPHTCVALQAPLQAFAGLCPLPKSLPFLPSDVVRILPSRYRLPHGLPHFPSVLMTSLPLPVSIPSHPPSFLPFFNILLWETSNIVKSRQNSTTNSCVPVAQVQHHELTASGVSSVLLIPSLGSFCPKSQISSMNFSGCM